MAAVDAAHVASNGSEVSLDFLVLADGGVTFHKRRGFEKAIFNLTIIFGILLVASLILGLYLGY